MMAPSSLIPTLVVAPDVEVVTVETLTDAMIREEFWRSLRTPSNISISRACGVALEWDGPEHSDAVAHARQRICAAINARGAKP